MEVTLWISKPRLFIGRYLEMSNAWNCHLAWHGKWAIFNVSKETHWLPVGERAILKETDLMGKNFVLWIRGIFMVLFCAWEEEHYLDWRWQHKNLTGRAPHIDTIQPTKLCNINTNSNNNKVVLITCGAVSGALHWQSAQQYFYSFFLEKRG